MKKLMLIAVFMVSLFWLGSSETSGQRTECSYFYDALAPQGRWIEIDNGLLAWHPSRVSYRWAPYQAGRWIWTSYGWYWDSYEPFGDITYHYGRWYNDDYYGWLWIPDDQWGPAWVEWRYDDDYIGWAPLSPYATFSISFGIRFSQHYEAPYNNWCFVSYRHFCEPRLTTYYVAPAVRYRIFSNTKYRTDYGYERDHVINRGVDRTVIERNGRVSITQREIVRVDNPRTTITRGGSRVEVFTPTREVMSRGDVSKINIVRSNRKTTLEINKVDIGRSDRNSGTKSSAPVTRQGSARSTEIQRNQTSSPSVTPNRDAVRTPNRTGAINQRTPDRSQQKIDQRNANTERRMNSRSNAGQNKTERKQEARQQKQEVRQQKQEEKNIQRESREQNKREKEDRRSSSDRRD